MIKKLKETFILSLVCLGLISCAQEKEESAMDIQKRILESYIHEYCPNATQLPSGLTYISKSPGVGTEKVESGNAVYVDYTTKTLAGIYSTTNDVNILKELGTYSKKNYYGPKLYEIGYGSTYLGIEELLTGMMEKESVTAIVPPWLTGTQYSSSSYNSSVNTIYTFKVTSIIKDMAKFQQDTMKAYAKMHYPGLDTLSSGFYYKLLTDSQKDTLVDGDNIKIRYVGKLLDGFVFDTNIRDSAKLYGIFDSTNDYDALSVVYKKDLSSFVESSNLVKGFCMAIQEMNYEEKSFTMFDSQLGYGSSGSNQIGAYQPLIFYIYLEANENEREEDKS